MRKFILTALLALASFSAQAQTPTKIKPSQIDFTGGFSTASLNGVRFSDQFGSTQAAITNACNGTAPGVVQLPLGTITLSATLTVPSYCTLRGSGMGLSTLRMAAGANLVSLVDMGSSKTNQGLRNLTVDCNSASNSNSAGQGGCVTSSSPTNLEYGGIEVKDYYGMTGSTSPCIGIGGFGANIAVHDSYIHGCGASGHTGDGIYVSGQKIRVQNNVIDSATDTGVAVEKFTDAVVSGNVVTNSAQGLGCSGLVPTTPSYGCNIVGNTVTGGTATVGAAVYMLNAAPGILSQSAVVGNVIRNTTSGAGIWVKRSPGVLVASNLLSSISPASTNMPQGILVQDTSNVSVRGNTVMYAGAAGIQFTGVGNFTLGGNHVFGNGVQSPGTYSGIVIADGTLAIATTITSGAITASSTPRVVTVAVATSVTVGTPLMIDAAGSKEYVVPTAVSGTSITAMFRQNHLAAATVAEAPTNSGKVSGNLSQGATQAKGLNIVGATDLVDVSDNDLRFNAADDGYANTATGAIDIGINFTNGVVGSYRDVDRLRFLQAPVLLNSVQLRSVTSGGAPVNLISLSSDNFTRFYAGVDANGFQWDNQAGSVAWMALTSAGLTIPTGEYVSTPKLQGVTDTGVVANLNADAVDGKHALSGSAALDFAAITAPNCAVDLTITVTGAAAGDPVSLAVPIASVTAGVIYHAWVSAASTVTVRACAFTGTPNPASGTFTAIVLH